MTFEQIEELDLSSLLREKESSKQLGNLITNENDFSNLRKYKGNISENYFCPNCFKNTIEEYICNGGNK